MKSQTFFVLLFACFPIFLKAQYLAGLEALNAKRFPEALGLFRQAGQKLPVLEQLGIARYYSTAGNPSFHLDSAYAYILSGMPAYRSLDDKKQEAVKKELGQDSPIKIKREIEKLWSAEVVASKDLEALNRFLAVAKNVLPAQLNPVTTLRDQLAFEAAYKQDTKESLHQLFTKYGESLRSTNPALAQKAGLRLFELFVKESGWAEQAKFMDLYPEANFARDTILIAMKNASVIAMRNKSDGWELFVRHFSSTVFEGIGMDSLSGFILQKGNLAQCEQYLKSWPNGPKREQIWVRLYQLYRSRQPDPTGLQTFAARFPDFPFQDRLKQDEKTAIEFFYKATMRSDSTGRMRRFVQSYPAYSQVDSVWLRYYTLVRARAKSPKEVEAFLNANPGMPSALYQSALAEKKEWEDRLQQQAYDRLLAAGHPTPLLNYAKSQPEMKFSKDAQQRLPEILLKSDSVAAIRAFLKAFPSHPEKQRVMERLYYLSNANRSLESIRAFVEAYPDFDSVRVKVDRAAIQMAEVFNGRYADERYAVYAQFIKEYAPSDEAFFILQKMMFKDFSKDNWQGVEDTLKQYAPLFAQKNMAFQDFYDRTARKELAKRRSPLKWEDGRDYYGYSPELTGNGKQLYFTQRGVQSETEDVFYTQYSDKGWSVPVPVTSLNTATKNEAVENISANGTEMLLFVSGDIYESKKTAQGWKSAGLLPSDINTSSWEGDSRYFPKGVIFVSGKGGSKDIYISLYGPDGKSLQKSFPIGEIINSGGNERRPFLHSDMKTLYFASDGHDGFGGYDIYMSTRLDDTWQNWSKPRNLGLLFNSAVDDWDFMVTTDGSRFYTVSDDGNGDKITYIDLPQPYKPESVYTFETVVLDSKGKPVEGEVVIQDLETGKIVQIVRPDPLTGAVFIPVSEKKNYRAELRKPDAPPVSLQIDFAQDSVKGIVEKPVIVPTTEDLKQTGKSITINNLFFETGSYTLLQESRFELNAMAQYLKDNNLAIEIQGHTDDVGSAESNQLLSENRASSVRTYLVSQGCDPEKIKAIGFGETRPFLPNVDKISREKNRRVEFRLL